MWMSNISAVLVLATYARQKNQQIAVRKNPGMKLASRHKNLPRVKAESSEGYV
jgi:hypothetical protein